MNNISEKQLVSVQDFLEIPSLKQPALSQDQKTRVSISQSDDTLRNQRRSSSENENSLNEGDQNTTLVSDIDSSKLIEGQTSEKVENKSDLKALAEGCIYHEGSILRNQKGIISSWEKRYIILTSGKLFFFENEKKIHLMGCIYIKHLPVSIIQNEKTFQLSASDGGETIKLQGENETQHKIWLEKIHDVISFCKSQKKVSIRKFNLSVYEQKDFALEEEFIEKAETGDLLLISSENSVAYLQKFITHSQFNHVAMIVRYQNQLKIFEANEDDGVSIYDWKQYVQTFKDHRRFAWRRLNFPNKYEHEVKLKQLIKKYLGRCYSISSTRMLRRTSQDVEEQEDRQFFCSEIIAKIYKRIGLLDREISSVRYWPISFTSRGDMNLLHGAFFSLEKNILLSKHLKL